MSGVNGHSTDIENGPTEEESKPLIEKLSDAGIIKASSISGEGDAQDEPKSVLKKRGGLAKSSMYRSVDNSLEGGNTSPGEKKQLLFRTASGGMPSEPLSVRYRSNDGGEAKISEEQGKQGNGTNMDSSNRFKVAKVSDESSDDFEEELPTSYDTRNLKSFKHYTREALPRADNYRNMDSVHGHLSRPTLDELHGVQTTVCFNKKSLNHQQSQQSKLEIEPSKQVKFGWIEGVLIRCLLNIWGVMLFLRLSWVAAQGGVWYGSIVVLMASGVTVITTLSMSAICTNGEVKTGGTYYMISRSLGPEFGGSIGVIFSLANAVAIAMYAVGFSESLRDLLMANGIILINGGMNDVRVISCITVVVLLGIVLIGTEWESKTQMGLLVILLVAMADFILGSVLEPSIEQKAKGFVGWNMTLFVENMETDYRNESFFSVFAIFFPAATGILAGANISGDLKDPSSAIPKGTMLAIIITTISYVGFLWMVTATNVRDANGIVELVLNATQMGESYIPYIRNCTLGPKGLCSFGSQNYFQILEMMAYYSPAIYAGIFAAALSSALASLVSAPKVFQALCQDKLFPGIEYFGKGFGTNNEPRRGYFLAFFIALACCLLGELNAIAPIISNFFLAAYVLINFSCFHAAFSKAPGFRPSYKWFNKWASLIGSIFCLIIMFITSWATALLTFVLVLALYIWVQVRKPDVNWGSSTQAATFQSAVNSMYRLTTMPDHVKTYRPQILLLCGTPSCRPAFIDLSYSITKGLGMMVCGQVVTSPLSFRAQNALSNDCAQWLHKNHVKSFYNLAQESSFYQGVKAMISSTGIGKLRPNIVMLGFKKNWINNEPGELVDYFQTIHLIFDKHLSLVIVSMPNGMDITQANENGDSVGINMDTRVGTPSSLSVDVSLFRSKQPKGFIDVWWLYDDGGLTLLLPYIISTHALWKDCKLRIFTLVNKKSELDTEQRNMAALLSKFRIDYSDVILITDILKPPKTESKKDFDDLIAKYVWDEAEDRPKFPPAKPTVDAEAEDLEKLYVSDSDLLAFKDKTNRTLRLRESMLEHSKDSRLIVMTLPMPRKNRCPAVLYMAWLTMLTKGMPPTMLIRGNQTDVLTFYS